MTTLAAFVFIFCSGLFTAMALVRWLDRRVRRDCAIFAGLSLLGAILVQVLG